MSVQTPPPKPTWLPDDASTLCMKCGIEFGRVFGASRHHCRACGELICNSCTIEATPQTHVFEQESHVLYLSPESTYELLERPALTSTLKTMYKTITTDTPEVVKFCEACNAHIQQEHTAFRNASYVLHTLRCLNARSKRRVVSVCVRAYLAKPMEPTGLGMVGRTVVQILHNGFYTPKVRTRLKSFDKELACVVSGFFKHYLLHILDTSSKPPQHTFSEIDSQPNHTYSKHIYISCMLNSSRAPTIRSDLLQYMIQDDMRCLHMLLSHSLLNYCVRMYPDLQTKIWCALLKRTCPTFLSKYAILLPEIVQSTSDQEDATPYTLFSEALKTIPTPKFKTIAWNLLYISPSLEFTNALSNQLKLTGSVFDPILHSLYSQLVALVVDVEQLHTNVEIPWTVPYQLTDLPRHTSYTSHHARSILDKIYSHEPRIMTANHTISQTTFHMARLFQSWFVFAEPNIVLHHAMRHVFDVITLVNQPHGAHGPVLYSNTSFLYPPNSTLALGIVPSTVPDVRIVNIASTTFSSGVEPTLGVLVMILLFEHLQTFGEFHPSESLALVEVKTTPHNTECVHSCLTFNSLRAMKQHLGKSLQAMVVASIGQLIHRIMDTHLPQLYMGLLCLTKHHVPFKLSQIHSFLDSIQDHVANNTTRDLVLKYIV